MTPLERGQGIAAMALTEDGKYLVGAATSANLLIIWDVRSGAEIKRISMDAPALLLCRGDLVYAAGRSNTLFGYSKTAGWAQVGQVVLSEPAVSLSAGWGDGFRQEIVAVVGKSNTARRVIDIDVRGWTAQPLGDPGLFDAAVVSGDGVSLLLQDHLGQTPGGIPLAYALAEFKRNPATARRLGKSDYGSYPFIYQTANSDVWYGQSAAYGGTPPKRIWLDPTNGIVVPDAARSVAYSLRADGLTAFDVSKGFESIGNAAVAFQAKIPPRTYNDWPWGVFPRATAVSLGNDLFVFFYWDAEKTIYRGRIPAFTSSAEAHGPGQPGAAPRFDPLPSTELIDSVAATEDGRFLVAAHRNANLITIWDLQTGREAARRPCPGPNFVLCRGTHAYVANAENGTIRILDQDSGWKVGDEVAVGSTGAYYLSAPAGAHFDGRVMAACHTPHGTQHFLVDTKRDSYVQAKGSSGSAATLSYSGGQVIAQAIGYGGPPTVYDFAAFVSGGPPGPANRIPEEYPYLFQVRDNDVWFGGGGMYADLNGHIAPMGVVAIPDLMRDVVYGIGRGTITAWRANAAMAPLGTCGAQTPTFLANFLDATEPNGGARAASAGHRRMERWKGYALRKGEGADIAAPIAVTLGDMVYLVLRDPTSKAVYRCAVAASAFSSPKPATVASGSPAGASSTGKVPTEQVVSTIALTDDGQFLVAAHESANQISVWDVRSGTLAKTISCQSPRSIICRGGRVYVANYGQGTITVFDPFKDWAPVARCGVGEPDVYYLSAPQGKFFANQILATCGKYKKRSVVLVDVVSASRSAKLVERDNLGAATVDYRGNTVVEQREFDWETMGYPQAFDYTAYLRGGAVPTSPALPRRTGLLAQVWPDAFWFDENQVAAGLPPAPLLRPANYPFVKAGLIVPDQSRPIFYRLEADGIHVRSAEGGLAEQGLVTAALPDWACRPSDRYAVQSTADTRVVPSDIFANPVSVTLDGRAYVFAVHGGALYRFTGILPIGAFQTPTVPTSQPIVPVAGQPGRLELATEPTFIARTRDGSALLLIEGNSLTLLDRDGRVASRTAELPVLYKKILDRSSYYVALSGSGIDLLDNRTLAVIRHIELGGIVGNGGTRDVALRPNDPTCYVSVADGEATLAGGASQEVPRVIEVDERTGVLHYLRHVYGQRLFVDSTGRQLAAWIPMHSVSTDTPWELGSLARFLSSAPLWRPAVFAFYQLDSKSARCIAVAENIGPEMTPDKNAVILTGSGLLREYAVNDLQKPVASYRSTAGGGPIAFDYHPRLGIVALSDDKGVTLYDRATGQPRQAGRYEINSVEQIVFAPSGRSVCIVGHAFNGSPRILASYPIELTPAEERIVAAAAPPEVKGVEVVDSEPELPSGNAEPREIQSLHLPAPAAHMNAAQVNQRYLRSVVLVGPAQPTFTGIAVGTRGYVITCAEAINSGANKLWLRTPTPQRQPYATAGEVQVIRVDPARNLALLKVPTSFEFAAPLAALAPEPGEPLTLLANGRTDFNGIYGLSVLTGTLSSAAETIHGVRYLQTTIAGGGGALGAPLFDSKGELIGLFVRRTRKEGVSFAIPAADIREFLNECIGPRVVPVSVNSKPSLKSGGALTPQQPKPAIASVTGQRPGKQGSPEEIPRPVAVKGSPAIAVSEIAWEKQVTGGTFFTSPDGEHIGWVQIDPRHIGQPGSSQGILDGARKPFGTPPIYSDDSKHVLYFLATPGAGGSAPLEYILDGAAPRAAAAAPANGRTVNFASGGRHVAWVSMKEAVWSQAAIVDGFAGKGYQRMLCEPSLSPDGAHFAYAAATANRVFIILDGKETAYDGQVESVVASAGHIAVALREMTQCHVEYDGQAQKPYPRISDLRLSSDGKHLGYIASTPNRSVLVIDGQEKDVPVLGVDSLTFGPEGHYACLGGKNNAQLILDGVPQGPSDVQATGRPSITFSLEAHHVAYLVDQRQPGSQPFAGGAPLPIQHGRVVIDGVLQPLPDEDGNALDRLTFSPDGRRLAYIVQTMSQPAFGPDGRPLAGYAASPRPIQRLVVDGVATDTFSEIRPPVFSADGKHYGCLAKRAGHDPIGRDDEWYIVLDGAVAPCRRPISKVPFFDAHGILHAYTGSLEQGPWHLTDVFRLEARSK